MSKLSNQRKTLLFSLLALATATLGGLATAETKHMPETRFQGTVIYVSPSGDNTADGTHLKPWASIKTALENLPSEEGGTIVLAGGTYTERVEIDGRGGPILITAAPGEKVIFEGGQRLTQWKPDPDRKGVYIGEAPERESLFGHTSYFDLWDDTERVRYGKVADANAVQYWAGTTMLEGKKISFHPHRDVAPESLNLWMNRRTHGIEIGRDDVTLQGINFQNYLGGSYARAVTILNCRDVSIQECTFRNCAMGVASGAEGVQINKCEFREVGNGVRQANQGRGIVVRRSIFEGAVGKFAFSDIDEHLSNGIRIYFYSDGATVEQCVTTGFWAGLYIKTISGNEGQLPYVVRNNTFLDGIRSGADCKHPRTTISHNIIGTPRTSEGTGKHVSYYREMGATLQDNLFIGTDAPEALDPFMNLLEGDLALKQASDVGATALTKVQWIPRTVRHLAPPQSSVKKLASIRPPIISASEEGAVIAVSLNQPAKVEFQYRRIGTSNWIVAGGYDATAYPATSMIAPIPFEQDPNVIYRWAIPLVKGEVESGRTYEYRLTAGVSKGDTLPVIEGTFSTKGGPRKLHVAAGAVQNNANGSLQHPFDTLQAALERALPGDTIAISPGIYSHPAIIKHGGLPEKRITIEGEGWGKTILDGGKRVGTILELDGAPNITLRGLQIRWFGNHGVTVSNSPQFEMDRCWIWNQSFTDTGACGIGIQITDSKGSLVQNSIFNKLQSAVIATRSPGFTFTHNTAFANVYSGLDLVDSTQDSIITHNSLTFSGNRALYIQERNERSFQSLQCDHNNYASRIREIAPKRPENDFEPAARYGILTGQSKAIIAITMGSNYWRDFHTMQDWQSFSSKDKHSIFADPDYVDPLLKDLRLLPDSPNKLADGSIIGALPIIDHSVEHP